MPRGGRDHLQLARLLGIQRFVNGSGVLCAICGDNATRDSVLRGWLFFICALWCQRPRDAALLTYTLEPTGIFTILIFPARLPEPGIHCCVDGVFLVRCDLWFSVRCDLWDWGAFSTRAMFSGASKSDRGCGPCGEMCCGIRPKVRAYARPTVGSYGSFTYGLFPKSLHSPLCGLLVAARDL